MGIIDEIKQNFKQGNNLIKLIYINIGIFLLANISLLFISFSNRDLAEQIQNPWFSFPSNLNMFLLKPWTIITYMFYHVDIWHIVFNLIFFYWFGQIFLQYLDNKKLVGVYLLGGISGAIVFSIAFNFYQSATGTNFNGILLGASAAIMAVAIAISVIVPNYTLNMLFIGPVKLKYIALCYVVLNIILIRENPGGNIAHLGGALFGYIFAVQYKKGKDLTKGLNSFLDGLSSLFKFKRKMKVTYQKPFSDFDYNKQKIDNQKEMDRILDKIAKGGYESLSKEEKDFLFRSSK
jgi:membrane associated rhomboid family serine protease